MFTAWIALSDVSSSSGPVRFIPGSNHWKDIGGLDFFNKNLISQEKILKDNYGNMEIVDALLSAGQVSIHSSHTYHSSGANLNETPRVGMVVHFCTDRAIRKRVTGLNSVYLDQLNDASISPFIFGGGS